MSPGRPSSRDHKVATISGRVPAGTRSVRLEHRPNGTAITAAGARRQRATAPAPSQPTPGTSASGPGSSQHSTDRGGTEPVVGVEAGELHRAIGLPDRLEAPLAKLADGGLIGRSQLGPFTWDLYTTSRAIGSRLTAWSRTVWHLEYPVW